MRIFELNWMQLEEYLEREDRIVLPLGSTEQHAYLSLGTDAILSERLPVEGARTPWGAGPAAPPLGGARVGGARAAGRAGPARAAVRDDARVPGLPREPVDRARDVRRAPRRPG